MGTGTPQWFSLHIPAGLMGDLGCSPRVCPDRYLGFLRALPPSRASSNINSPRGPKASQPHSVAPGVAHTPQQQQQQHPALHQPNQSLGPGPGTRTEHPPGDP